MNRRRFLKQTAVAILAARRSFPNTSADTPEVHVSFNREQTMANIPPDFMGLGYEISSVARPGVLSAQNKTYIQLVKTLASQGVIRVGGNTADYASYSSTAQPLSSPETRGGSVVNDAVLRDLGGFLTATGWKLIWGLNLGNGTLANAIDEAKAVIAVTSANLLAFEIGNEPDLFRRRHRQAEYGYDDYLREYRAWKAALRQAAPDIIFAGPDAAIATDWVTRFAADEGKDCKHLTHHYYREGQNRTSTAEKLLNPDPKLAPMLEKLKAAATSCGVPYRICETNSFSGGGKPGVSDTLTAALWVLDFMFALATAGCAGVNLETGVNQLGFISSYSPIDDDEHGAYWAAPEYYGMLAFAQAGAGRMIASGIDAGGRNIKAFATEPSSGRIILTLINKETSVDVNAIVSDQSATSIHKADCIRLAGPSLASKSGITLGGAQVSNSGAWKAADTEELTRNHGAWRIRLPEASAAIVTLYR